jgi:hypothetical protein
VDEAIGAEELAIMSRLPEGPWGPWVGEAVQLAAFASTLSEDAGRLRDQAFALLSPEGAPQNPGSGETVAGSSPEDETAFRAPEVSDGASADSPQIEAEPGADGAPVPAPAGALEKVLGLSLEMNRLLLVHNGEPASAEFLGQADALVDEFHAALPEEVHALASEHASDWEQLGWPLMEWPGGGEPVEKDDDGDPT